MTIAAGVVTIAVAGALLLASPSCAPGVGSADPASTTSQPPGVSSTRPQPQATSTTPEPGCLVAEGKAASLLPSPTEEIRIVLSNPCIPLTELAGAVLDFVPESDERVTIDKAAFGKSVKRLSGRVFVANDIAECAYQTDRLAIAIYQQPAYRWSVGVVAVIRGHIGATAEVAACYITSQVIPRVQQPSQTQLGPQWKICADASRPTERGEVYTVLTVGDSDVMCQFLAEARARA